MPNYKVVMQFVNAQGETWDEVYYQQNASAFQAAYPPGALIKARTNFLHTSCLLQRIRAFNISVGAARESSSQVLNTQGAAGSTENPAVGSTAVVCTMAGIGTRNILHWFRGLTQSYVVLNPNTGFPEPPPSLTNALSQFFKALAANLFGIYAINSVTTNPKYSIFQVSGNVGSDFSTVQVAGLGAGGAPLFTANQRILIGQADRKSLPGLNGRWTVISSSVGGQNTNVLLRYTLANAQATVNSNAYARLVSYQSIVPFSTLLCQFQNYGNHDTRSIFTHSRGAKRAVRLRTSV